MTDEPMKPEYVAALASRDQAWACARDLADDINALADNEVSPADNPDLCKFLACLVAGDVAMRAGHPEWEH